MTLATLLAVSALVCSIALLQHPARIFSVVGVIASAAEVTIAFELVKLSVTGVRLELLLGGALVVVGVVMFSKSRAKLHVGAAAIVAFIGALQVLAVLRVVKG